MGESLSPGDKLPAERDLAERLNVSRTVVREALRTLSIRGLVEIKPGSGTYVAELTSDATETAFSLLLQSRRGGDSFRDLYEIRRMIEVEVAGMAAERATEADIEAMEEAIHKMADNVDSPAQFTQYDLDFHSSLVAAADNQLIPVLLDPIVDRLLSFRLVAYRYDREGAIDGALVHHRSILAHVKAHDPAGARQTMSDHLRQAETLMEAMRSSTHES